MSKGYEITYDQLKFTDDFMFCKILENNPDLCKELLEVILGVKIRKIERISKQKEIKDRADGKGVRFDVYLEDADNTVFDIEMQTTKKSESHLTKRIQEEVENARHQEEWRHEYMTLTEKYEEYFEEGREEGAIKTLTSLVSKGLLTVEEAATELGVSVEEFQQKMQSN